MIINQNVSGGGTTPTGTTQITTNGIHDVTNYATADVQVPTTAPAYYVEKAVDNNGKLINSNYIINLNGVTDLGDYSFCYLYYYNTLITNSDFNFQSLKKITGSNTLNNGFSYSVVRSCLFPELEFVNGNFAFYETFNYCRQLTTLSCPKLTQLVSGSSNLCSKICSDASALTSVNFDSLKKVAAQNCFNYSFMRATSLTSISFPAFNSTTFGGYKNQFNYAFASIIGCTIHFPKNLDPQGGSTVISSLDGYPNFGGTNTVLAFDLPSTFLLTGANSVVYERSPKDDTVSALAWRVQDTGTVPNLVIDWTPFYTSTTSDPSVGDTIYSDSACTTAVTTISSIA